MPACTVRRPTFYQFLNPINSLRSNIVKFFQNFIKTGTHYNLEVVENYRNWFSIMSYGFFDPSLKALVSINQFYELYLFLNFTKNLMPYLPITFKNNKPMNYFILLKKTIPLFFVFLLFSCTSRKNLVYYQDIDSKASKEKLNSYEIKIQPDDLLMIIVSAEDPEIAIPFNLTSISLQNIDKLDVAIGQRTQQSYLVDTNGFIEFPVLGKLKVGGLTRTEVLKMLQGKIGVYIKNPIINLRIMNFKVSVQGEVNIPGSYNVASERVTLIEALTMAKDLTIYGKRNNILVIREIDGVKSFNRVDITKADFINSHFYYLSQNDVVYVEPNKTRINGAAVGTNSSIILSALSILVTITVLIFH